LILCYDGLPLLQFSCIDNDRQLLQQQSLDVLNHAPASGLSDRNFFLGLLLISFDDFVNFFEQDARFPNSYLQD
jgi:hypothetical protein